MVRLNLDTRTAGCLDDLVIKTPCTVDWNRMDGDGRRRYCSRCEKQVYNIAAMTRSEALALIAEGSDRICARIYRRADGTVVTSECPTAPHRGHCKPIVKRRFQFSIATLVALLTSSAALFASAPWIGKKLEPLVQRWFGADETTIAVPGVYCTIGAIELTPEPISPPLIMPVIEDPGSPAPEDPSLPEPFEVEAWALD